MKMPYGWIREFVELALGPEEAADRLINAGIEVASVRRLAPAGLGGVVVGEIEAIERDLGESRGHRLVLCRVSTGRERFAVVCGAPNAAVGVRAAFAPPGAMLPDASAGFARASPGGGFGGGRRDPLRRNDAAGPFSSAYANCLRNRKSFSKKRRMSSMPYLSMAIRSIPMPNAHPVTSSGS